LAYQPAGCIAGDQFAQRNAHFNQNVTGSLNDAGEVHVSSQTLSTKPMWLHRQIGLEENERGYILANQKCVMSFDRPKMLSATACVPDGPGREVSSHTGQTDSEMGAGGHDQSSLRRHRVFVSPVLYRGVERERAREDEREIFQNSPGTVVAPATRASPLLLQSISLLGFGEVSPRETRAKKANFSIL